jgi:uncharacterized protein YbcI
LILNERRAKTRDEMYSFYLTFGEEPQRDQNFMAFITNILRNSLEGILTNSELFYRDVQQQNRRITRPNSIKDTYTEFATAIIQKLISYQKQCLHYNNQCIKEFREAVIKYEIDCRHLPKLVLNEIYQRNIKIQRHQIDTLNKEFNNQLKRQESIKVNILY